ncbi:MAG: hypothetical protein HN891_01255 [Planctomycetes bacterium]|nr:hypothetical protein [Planctomycetota bacterium]
MRTGKTPSRPPHFGFQIWSMALVLLISSDPEISARSSPAAWRPGPNAERPHPGEPMAAPSTAGALDHEDRWGPQIRLRQANSRHCTSILAARCGVRFDTEYGGSAARAALLASCHLLSDSDPHLGSIYAWPEISSSDGVIWIHHLDSDLPRLLNRLDRLLDGAPAPIETRRAIDQLAELSVDKNNPCACISRCCCRSQQRILHRMVEAIDPLPQATRRSGCPRRALLLRTDIVDQWRNEHIHAGSTVVVFECAENLANAAVRTALGKEIQSHLHANPIRFRPAVIDRMDFLRPCRTIVSPPTICSDAIPAESERIVAGWIADTTSPISAVGPLEPRVELWNETIQPGETASIALLRLLARRVDRRLRGNSTASVTRSEISSVQQALLILRSNDPEARTLLPRHRRSAPVITVLRRQQDD